MNCRYTLMNLSAILILSTTTAGAIWTSQEGEKSTAQIVEEVSASVVVITAETSYPGESAQGSGVVIGDGQTVVTNVHVVAGASHVEVHLLDGRSVISKGFLNADTDRDLVTVSLPKKLNGIAPVKLVDSENLRIGEKVVAIGSPQGLTNTVSEGIVSGIREFETGTKVIQTTAPVSPGSSGGGLFNAHGELLGITTFLRKGGQNLNFAYPAEYILPLLKKATLTSFAGLSSSERLLLDETAVFVTRTGRKFHRMTCRYLRKSMIPMELVDALERGYGPCSVCKPFR